MQALNQQERKKTFTNFLLFYIVTTLIIIAGVFFGTQVPLRQNKMMQTRIAQFEKEKIIGENFTVKSAEIKNLIDTVNSIGVSASLIEGQMDQKIASLSAAVEADSTSARQLYRNMIKVLSDSKLDKAALRSGATTATTSAEKDKTIAELKGKIQEYATALSTCQNQLIQLSK